MKILIIAPLPPPITGHSIVSKSLADGLSENHDADVVNLSKDSLKEGVDGFKRIAQVGKLLLEVRRKSKNSDVVYFTISESFAGNLKDLLIYFFCRRILNRTVIHLHGGSIKRLLWDNNRTIFSINKYFIKKLGGVIVSGKSHLQIFENIIDKKRIHIVPNFANDRIFLTPQEISDKHLKTEPLRILYMSNLIPKKGYNELAEAFFLLDENSKKNLVIDFAGAFDSENDKRIFLDKIGKSEQLKYHGIITEEAKKKLFNDSHVFCLPTSYFEGQPISILEAYASGCIVLTTGQSGILDIFQNNKNGFLIKDRTAISVKESIVDVLNNKNVLLEIALQNNSIAKEKYRQSAYVKTIETILKNIIKY